MQLNRHMLFIKRPLFSSIFILLLSTVSYAQQLAEPDKSPMDIAYYPHNFAHDRKPGEKAIIRVMYSRPQKNGREVFGKLIPFNKVWRTGANENTEIKFYQDVKFGGKKVKAGTYSLFTIPAEKEWTIILNSDLDYWGSYSYNAKNDVLRVTAPVTQLQNTTDYFTIQFDKGVMKLVWDKTSAEVPVTVLLR